MLLASAPKKGVSVIEQSWTQRWDLKLGVELYMVDCQGLEPLGVPAPRFIPGGHSKVGACKSILFTEIFSQIAGVCEVREQNGGSLL